MRILITQDTDWLLRNPGQQHHLADRLSARNCEVRVVDYEIGWRNERNGDLLTDRMELQNCTRTTADGKVRVIRPPVVKIPLLHYVHLYFSYNSEIRRQIEEFRPDIIIGHSIATNYLSMKWAKRKGIPFVFHMTDAQHTIVPNPLLKPVAKLIEARVLAKADCVVVINDELRDYAIRMGSAPDKTRVIKAGIDLDRYDPNKIDGEALRRRLGVESGDLLLFFMGWLYSFSGLHEVIREMMKPEYSKVKLLVVGDGDSLNDLRTLSKSEVLENRIHLMGRLPFPEMPKMIAAADICVLPSHANETMRSIVPIKLYEYMAMRKPVISTSLRGVEREFGMNSGITFVKRPEDVVGEALRLRMTDRLEAEGLKSRNFVEHMDWNVVVDEFESVLKEVLLTKCGRQLVIR